MEYSPFSCFGKKRAKRSRLKRALCVALPRAKSVPLKNHPAALTMALEHLNLHPEHSKNVPIFAVQWFCFGNSAGRKSAHLRT